MVVCSTRYIASVITLHSEVTLTITFHYRMLRAKGHGLAGYRNVQNKVHSVLELILSSQKMNKFYLVLFWEEKKTPSTMKDEKIFNRAGLLFRIATCSLAWWIDFISFLHFFVFLLHSFIESCVVGDQLIHWQKYSCSRNNRSISSS